MDIKLSENLLRMRPFGRPYCRGGIILKLTLEKVTEFNWPRVTYSGGCFKMMVHLWIP
jgi:hypothetical protein